MRSVMRWAALSGPILTLAVGMSCTGSKTRPTPPELSGACPAPSFEEFCSARRAHLLTKDGDPYGLDAGQGWLNAFPERCGVFDRIPAEWPGECDAADAR